MTPGAQLLIAKNGSVIYQKSYGFHTYEKKTRVSNDDVYDLASLTKILASLPLIINEFELKKDFDFLIVDFHGEITSEKNAIGHFFDGKATLVIGTHTHIPTNDARILKNGTAYQTDAGMCGDYDSVIGMNKDNSLNRFMKKDSIKHFPAKGEAT